jgi:ATP-dependent helicase/nuclease subunit A
VESLGEIIRKNPPPYAPDIAPLLGNGAERDAIRREIKKYFDFYSVLITARRPPKYGEMYAPLVEAFKLIKGSEEDGLYHELESIANYALNFDLCAGMFGLLKKFQDDFNAKKRKTGLLSFNDVAHLAIDILKNHPDIRKIYKDSIKKIMIDEFQDNNALQRDLVYLLAENPERTGNSVAGSEELEKDRLFFVGDEKQSIYRFRGADVAVFRSLENNLSHNEGDAGGVGLGYNYRSRPLLIAAFNHIFEKVFLPQDKADYEAVYRHIKPAENSGGKDAAESFPLANFCFLNGDALPKNDKEGIKAHDLEAAFIAGKIRDMVNRKEKIPKRTETGIQWTECTWSDFAVLERSYSHQNSLEKYFRRFEVPYNTDRPSGLFYDAPILDLRAYLRLLVYPEDRVAYATLIRSPFTRLSDLTLAACMLRGNEPFAEENERIIPEEDRGLYRLARERYRYYRLLSRTLSVTELITKLWYEEGYRYETLSTKSAQAYESLFDLFFSFAGESDRRGNSLVEFVDYLEDVKNREEKPDDKDIPGEGETGVRILSIHKSKGLEFPVVFIYDSTRSGIGRNSSSLIDFHEEYGIILSIPQAEEMPLGGNYFGDVFREEEKAKDAAELKRLLYVAMTRAESRLFLTFTLPGQNQKARGDWDIAGEEFNEGTIRRRLLQLHENSEDTKETFLKLLQGILPCCPASLCGIEIIPILSIEELSAEIRQDRGSPPVISALARNARGHGDRRAAALAAAAFYDSAEIIPETKQAPHDIHASALRYTQTPAAEVSVTDAAGESSPYSRLDDLLEQTGISPADFGSLVHAVLEGRLKGQGGIPPKIKPRMGEKKVQGLVEAAESMAGNFLSSELGRRFAVAGRKESEFKIVTSVLIAGKPIVIMGQIDLLFVAENEVVVVDFKTDKIENPAVHYGQLAAYHRAVGDIFGKPVSVWLFYLRSGSAVNVTQEVGKIPLEHLIHPLDYKPI